MSLITPDFGLLFWMVLIFGAVFFILAKFGFPVITKAVQKRSDHIEDSLRMAEKARASVDEAVRQREQMLEETRSEQDKMLKEASRTREAILGDAREKAQAEAAEMIRNARAEIAAEKEFAMQELRSEVSALSVAVAEKVVREKLESTPEQQALLQRYADEAKQAELN